jgi:multidrug efflux pump subunit AcrA (membrane-fusion protein)
MKSALILIPFLILLSACSGKPEQVAAAAVTPPPAVRLSAIEAFDAPPALSSTASFAAIDAAEIAPETEGVVREIFVRLGDSVNAGQPLLRLEDREAQLRLAEAQARVHEMQAVLRQAEARLGADGQRSVELSADVLNAQAAVDNAEEEVRLAEIEEARASRLRATKDISQSSYDRTRSTLLSAQARLRGARQQLALATNTARQSAQGIAMAKAQLESAQAQEAQARKRATDAILRAPFAGVVTARSVSVGEYVNPQAKPLRLEKVDPLKLVFQLPEAQAASLAAGLAVEAQVTALPGETFHGKLRAPNGALDPSSRALTVEAEFPNPQRRLKPGYFAEARILLGGAQPRLRLPVRALDFDPRTETYRVWTVAGGRAKLHLVGVPQKRGENAELPPSAGLAGGAAVIVDPPANLYDGMTVTPAEKK